MLVIPTILGHRPTSRFSFCVPLDVFRASRHDAVGKCPAAASASAAACRDLQLVKGSSTPR